MGTDFEDGDGISTRDRRISGCRHRHAGWLPAVGAGLDAGGCRNASGAGDPRASALPQARRHYRPRSADPSLFRRPRLCLDPRRHARQWRFRRADGRRIFRAGVAGRLRRDRLGAPPALVQRQCRHDGHFLGRLQLPAGRGQAAAGAEGGDHPLLDRRPLCRRHPLQGRLLLNENFGWASTMLSYSSRPPDPLLVGDNVGATYGSTGWRTSRFCSRRCGSSTSTATPTGSAARSARIFPPSRPPCLSIGGWATATRMPSRASSTGINAPAKGIVGPWIHKYPHFAVPQPGDRLPAGSAALVGSLAEGHRHRRRGRSAAARLCHGFGAAAPLVRGSPRPLDRPRRLAGAWRRRASLWPPGPVEPLAPKPAISAPA